MSDLVLVTGSSGYIASTIVRDLLADGYRVRGTVRNPNKIEELDYLRKLPGAAERLELVAADLLTPGAFDKHVEGCAAVMHTASPYKVDVKNPQQDLVEPALLGTRNVLDAALRSSSIRRVVMTSSMAAITDEPDEAQLLTEADWNTKSSLERNPYYYSKTVAEREAWAIVERSKPAWDLVVINPFLVVGPSLTPALNPSNQVFADILSGVYPGIMNIVWGFVDVRDVAQAHLLAMKTRSASGRYICAGARASMRDVVNLLRASGYGEGYKLPRIGLDCATGDFLVKLSSYMQPKGVGDYLRSHIGRVPNYDNGKIQRELGLQFRDVNRSILDSVEDLIHWGHLPVREARSTHS